MKSSQKRGFRAERRKRRAKQSPSSHRAQGTTQQPSERAGICLLSEARAGILLRLPNPASPSAVKRTEATNYFVGRVKRPTNSSALLLNAVVPWLSGLGSAKHAEIKALPRSEQHAGTCAQEPCKGVARLLAELRLKITSLIPRRFCNGTALIVSKQTCFISLPL